jgi:hypothetical protein
MIQPTNSAKPSSLTQHFEAPGKFIGAFGWICGYSADAEFMNLAAERFTRQTQGQRAHGGKAALALLLDPGNPCLTFCAVPGVVHLPINNLAKKPFVLLHAKVAILGFRHSLDASKWTLRLIVSTGNWTRQTLEDSLDLAWCVDVSSDDLANPDDSTLQACADFKAAWKMFDWLMPHFDSSLLAATRQDATIDPATLPQGMFDIWLAKVASKGRGGEPRFFTSIKESLLKQLPALVKNTGAASSRNYLAMGSGFYEAASEGNAVPIVVRDIVAFLKKEDLLTKSAKSDIFVNPQACQAVASCVEELNKGQFEIWAAHAPEKLFGKNCERSLHAKFIFSANRKSTNNCNNAWLYLGSGNLTGPGFTSKVSKKGGNLEAGVVFSPQGLQWEAVVGQDTAALVTDLLPIQRNKKISEAEDLKTGGDMEVRDEQFVAAPVAWLLWCEDAAVRWLQVPDGETEPFTVLDDTGAMQQADDQKRVVWSAPRPREVTISWVCDGEPRYPTVPVVDEYGRIAGAALPKLELDQAWWELANFPLPPEEDESDDQEQDSYTDTSPPSMRPKSNAAAATYPIRRMMELVENIADKQTRLLEADWTAWCVRLEQCLLQVTKSQVLAAFKQLDINPVSPLWHSPFRPDFAQNGDTPAGKRYEAVLQQVEHAWGVTEMKKLGATHE